MPRIAALCLACLALSACAHVAGRQGDQPETAPAKLSPAEVKSRVDPLLSELESEDFRAREKAQAGLQSLLVAELGSFDTIVAYLRRRLESAQDAETQERLKRLMESHVRAISLYLDAELVVLAEVCDAFHADLWDEGAAIFGNEFRILAFLKGESPLQISLVDEERAQGVDGWLKKTYYTLPDTSDNLYVIFMRHADRFRVENNITVLAPTGEHGSVADAICEVADPSLKPLFDVPGFIRQTGQFSTLLDSVGDKEPNVRLHAVRVLGNSGSRKVMEPLVRALYDSDAWVRQAAAHSVDRLIGPRQRPVFVEDEEDELVPEELAAAALGPLVRLLADENFNVRWAAAQALGDTGDARALKALTGALADDNPSVRLASVIALGKIQDRRIVRAVVSALGDKSAYVRSAAVGILMERKDPGTVEPLCRMLQDKVPGVRWKAALALLNIRDGRAVGPLVGALNDSDSDVRRAAVEALGEIGDAGALEGLARALGDSQQIVRARAAASLGQIGGPGVVGPLIKALEDGYWVVRRNAAESLGRIGDARAVKPLVELLDREKVGEVRGFIIEALGAFQVPEAIDALVKAAKDTASGNERQALEALGKMPDEKAVKALGEALDDPDPYMGFMAAEALRYSPHPKALEVLIGALGHKSPDIRLAAAESLGKKGDAKAVEPLVKLLGDNEVGGLVADSTPVSGFAEEALKGIGQPALPSLHKVLGEEKDEQIIDKLKGIIEAIENKGQ